MTELLMQVDILNRPGWTRTLVKKLLGEPDRIKKRYGGGTITFYQQERVEQVEKSEAFQQAQVGMAARKAAARKAVETKTADTMELARTTPIEVDVIENPTEAAIAAYNIRQLERGIDRMAHQDADPAFLQRITVNYIRHSLARYDDALYELFNRTGNTQAALVIRWRVLKAIAARYPQFSAECTQQMMVRWE